MLNQVWFQGAGGLVDGKTDGFILSPKPVLEWLKLGVPARNMCNYLPSKFESFRKHTLSSSWTSWTGGILTGKIMLWGEVCLVKVVHYIEKGFLNIQTPVKMTPYPPRLQFQTSWTEGILTQKMTLWGYECFGNVVQSIVAGVLNIPTPVRMTPCHPRLQFQTSWTGGILT